MDYYKSAGSIAIIIGSLLVCVVISIFMLLCFKKGKAPWEKITTEKLRNVRIINLFACSAAIVCLILLVTTGYSQLEDALTREDQSVKLLDKVLISFQNNLDRIEKNLNETLALEDVIVGCAPTVEDEITESFQYVEDAVSLMADATDARSYASTVVDQLKTSDDFNEKFDRFFVYAWIAVVVLISFVLWLLVSTALAMKGKHSRPWLRSVSSWFVLPVINILFIVTFCLTLAFCFGSVVLADSCADPNGLILRMSTDPAIGGISSSEAETMNYYLTW